MNRMGVLRLAPYLLIGAVLWYFVLKSGVHATLAGVALALAIPLRPQNQGDTGEYSPLHALEHALHKPVALLIVPVFGFANAGVSFAGLGLATLAQPVPLGVALGLFLGKQLGVFGFAWLAIKSGIASLPPSLGEAARVLRLGPWRRLLRLVLPGAAPSVFAGLRLALIYAWLGTIGAEYFMPSDGGIGSLMIGAQQLLRMDLIMAGMLLVGLTGALLNALGQRIEARATRWRHA